MKKNWLIPLLCLALILGGCGRGETDETGGTPPAETADIPSASPPEPSPEPTPEETPEPTPEPSPSPSPAREMDPEDVARLEGGWTCVAAMVEGELVLFSDVPELGDLYDQYLSFYPDGSYSVLDAPGHEGVWTALGSQPPEGFDHSYLLSKQNDVTYSFDGEDVTTNKTPNTAAYLVYTRDDMPDTLVWMQTGSGNPLLLFRREGAEDDQPAAAESAPSQSPAAIPSRAPAASDPPPTAPASSTPAQVPAGNPSGSATMGERNALGSALDYLDVMAFSYTGLIEQLEFEGYSHAEAVYGADHCGADWYEQAARSAAEYLDVMSFSRSELIEQLEFEGFTHDQAVYGVDQNGY